MYVLIRNEADSAKPVNEKTFSIPTDISTEPPDDVPLRRRFHALQALLGLSLTAQHNLEKSHLFYEASQAALQMTGAQAAYLFFRQQATPSSERLGESVYYRLDRTFYANGALEKFISALPQQTIEQLGQQVAIQPRANASHLVVPIHRAHKGMALLDLVHSAGQRVDDFDVELMSQLVQQLDISLRNNYLISASSALVELAHGLSTELDLAVLLDKVAKSAAQISNAQASAILLIQPDNEVMRFAAAYGQAEQDREMLRQLIVPLAGSIAGSVALSGQPLVSNDVADDPRFYAGISDTVVMKTRSLLAVPMMADDKPIGALEVINQRYDDGFDEADVEILTLFANQAAIVIQNARLLAERQASLAELTKLEQRKSQFIALASHELRTPLNLISGYSSLLRSSLPDCQIDADHEVMDFLGQIDEATSRLTGMVNNITSLYNLETGRTQLLLEKRDVIPIIHEVMAEYREWGRKKGIDFRCQLPAHPLYATCDPIEVNRILGNLVNNAVKCTPEGGQITISAANTPSTPQASHSPSGRCCDVRVSVRDTGPGIDSAQLESVFERFFQLGNHLNRVQSGLGLGLPLAKSLVEKHGGQLWAEANPGVGAVFHFTLPAAR